MAELCFIIQAIGHVASYQEFLKLQGGNVSMQRTLTKANKSTVYVSEIPFLHVSNIHKHLGQRVPLDISVLRLKGLYNNDSRLSYPVPGQVVDRRDPAKQRPFQVNGREY